MKTTPSSHHAITFCITELDVGGAEKALVKIAIGLSQLGWTVRVISLRDKGPLAESLESADIPVSSLNCGGFSDIRTYWRLQAELRKHATDVLFCFLHQANIYGRMAGKSAGIPFCLSGVRVADRRWSVIVPERLTRCCVDHYVAVSRHVAKMHAQLCRIPDTRITAIPNGVLIPQKISPDLQQTRHDELLFVGRLTKQKDPLTLVKAFTQLPDQIRQKTKLTFVGDGPLRQTMLQLINSLQLAENVTILGHRNDVVELMQRATLLVLPSRWEGMPNVVLEAMANNLPVIATAVDGTLDLVQHERTGWLVEPQQPQQLATAIAEALTGPEKRRQIARNAQNLVAMNYDWNSIVKRYDGLLRSLVSQKLSGHSL